MISMIELANPRLNKSSNDFTALFSPMSVLLETPDYTRRLGWGLEDQVPHQAAKVVYQNFPTPNATVTDNVDHANKVRQYMTSNFLTTKDQEQVHVAKARSRAMIMKKELLQQVPFTVQILQNKASVVLNDYLGISRYEGPYSGKRGYNYLETFASIPKILQPKWATPRKLLVGAGVVLFIMYAKR